MSQAWQPSHSDRLVTAGQALIVSYRTLGRSLMRSHNWSIRSKIIAMVAVPLSALLALWIFATVVTSGPALTLLSARDAVNRLGDPGLPEDLRMVAEENATQKAADILALETRIAEASWTRVDRRDDKGSDAPTRACVAGRVVPVSSRGRQTRRGDRLGPVGSRRTWKCRQTFQDHRGQALTRKATMPIKVREMIKMLEADGWELARQKGSHRQFVHTVKPGVVTIAGKPSADLPIGTERSILKQAGL